jgi:hypothetical protein
MKKLYIVFIWVIATLACCPVSKASITNAWWNTDGSGDFAYSSWSFTSNSLGGSLYMNGLQYTAATATLVGGVKTSDPTDPTLTLSSAVNNDSGQMWIGYQVDVILSSAFTFVAPSPSVNNPPNNDWVVASVIAPTLQVSGPYTGDYLGTVNLSAGTPIGIGDELDFSYSINFTGSSSYALTQSVTPEVAPVPEPGTVTLLAIGGLGFAMRLCRNRRKGA